MPRAGCQSPQCFHNIGQGQRNFPTTQLPVGVTELPEIHWWPARRLRVEAVVRESQPKDDTSAAARRSSPARGVIVARCDIERIRDRMAGFRNRLRHVGHGRLDRIRRRAVAAGAGSGGRRWLQLLRHRLGLRQGPQRAAARRRRCARIRARASTSRPRSRRRTRNGRRKAETPIATSFPADHIREYTEKSLQNLGVETIDLQQFHVWSDAWADDEGWQRAVDDLKRES